MTTSGSRREYCSVYGCLNSTLTKPTISFFKLPADVKRRTEWLRLISREELLHRPHSGYTVCQEHFAEHDVMPGARRKVLKKQSLPTLKLPNLQKNDQETQTINVTQINKHVQTENTFIAHKNTQTPAYLLAKTPRKRKLQSNVSETKKKSKLHDVDSETHKVQLDTFHRLCKKFLPKKLARFMKAKTDFKLHNECNK